MVLEPSLRPPGGDGSTLALDIHGSLERGLEEEGEEEEEGEDI